MAENDGEPLKCIEGDCPIPELEGEAGRLMEAYMMLQRLKDLGLSDNVAGMYSLTPADLRSLAEINAGVIEMEKTKNG